MKILALETSTAACSIALLNDAQTSHLHKIAPKQQGHLVLPMIDELLATANLKLAQLEAIAYSCGPGSFTGIRIASSVVQGLGLATGLPLIPISSLAALAQTAALNTPKQYFAVAVDARMEQVYWAIYELNSKGLVV